jgi:hypothetical protein
MIRLQRYCPKISDEGNAFYVNPALVAAVLVTDDDESLVILADGTREIVHDCVEDIIDMLGRRPAK